MVARVNGEDAPQPKRADGRLRRSNLRVRGGVPLSPTTRSPATAAELHQKQTARKD
jgi:hypothetical protein